MAQRGNAYVWFLAAFAAIVAGFWPTFYGDPRSNDVWHTIHGVAWTLWLTLLVTQSLLIGRKSRTLHGQLGWLSLALFTALFATSCYMVWLELTGIEPFPAILRQQLVFLDITFLALFLAIYVSGIIFRRTPELHARLMGSTILIGLGPALVRLYAEHVPQLHGLAGALPWTFLTIDMILVIAILVELRRRKMIWPFPSMLVAFIVIEIGTEWASGAVFAGIARSSGAPI